MAADILLVVIFTAIAQSVFGVGILLFGTPLLLLLGHDFVEVLVALLPVSLVVNLLQVIKHRTYIDFGLYRKVLIYALPPIAIFLFLVTHARIDLRNFIGVFLLVIAANEFLPMLNRTLNVLMRYETLYCVLMGIVHGISNLGGSLLTALVHHKQQYKEATRATIAISYATFAIVQLLTLALSSGNKLDISFVGSSIFMLAGVLVFLLVERTVFSAIAQNRYKRLFAAFLAISGISLLR